MTSNFSVTYLILVNHCYLKVRLTKQNKFLVLFVFEQRSTFVIQTNEFYEVEIQIKHTQSIAVSVLYLKNETQCLFFLPNHCFFMKNVYFLYCH